VLADWSIHSNLRRTMARALACVLALSCAAIAGGQEISRISPDGRALQASRDSLNPEVTIHVRSDLVLIPVTVTDKHGRAVSGLEKEHFTLFEDDAQQEITHFSAEDAPISLAIVFDVSDSMASKLPKAREAVKALLNSINRDSEASLITFSTRARLIVPLTNRFAEIRDFIGNVKTSGSTALLDGVHLAMTEMAQARHLRKAIIIISDGEDNTSHWTVNELKAAVREQDTLIYAVALTDLSQSYAASPEQMAVALLKEITGQTGGYTFPLSKLQQLPEIASKIGGLLRNQYILGYVPKQTAAGGTYRTIRLKLARPKGYPRLQAFWRQGYFTPKD
jgi:Ca-activated chloride channel homolog